MLDLDAQNSVSSGQCKIIENICTFSKHLVKKLSYLVKNCSHLVKKFFKEKLRFSVVHKGIEFYTGNKIRKKVNTKNCQYNVKYLKLRRTITLP